ncbi:MAG: PQQ-binding-like beta-propeller repeat protein [Planctomycetales bacterium]|nr:PQQ-binding-like beta-propeller repeat protein [Planctomycetales bacterium]
MSEDKSVENAAETPESSSPLAEQAEGQGRGSKRARTRRGTRPGFMTWAIALFFAGLSAATWFSNWFEDHALTNVFTVVFAIDVGLTFLVWLIFFSGHSQTVRGRVIKSLCLALLAMVVVLRPVRTSGDLLPSFRFFWQASGKETPPATEVASPSQGIDLKTTSATDFAQYLGPDRNGVLPGAALEPDWEQHPPRQLWRQPIGAGWSGFVVVNGYAVTMEQREDQEWVSCYVVESGELVWTHVVAARHDTLMGGLGPRSTPAIDDGRVYALGATGQFRCLDGATGELLWDKDLLEEFGVAAGSDGQEVAWGRSNSPLVVGGQVVIPGGGPSSGPWTSLVAFDKRTGKRLWTGGDDQISYSSPVVYSIQGVDQIVSVNEKTVSGHALDTGDKLWSLPWKGSTSGPANTSQPMRIDDGRLLVSKGYNMGGAEILLRRSGDQWQAEFGWQSGKVLRTKLTNTLIKDGYAYALNDGVLQCVDLANGERIWKGDRLRHGQPLLVGDHLLVMSEGGDLHLYDASPSSESAKPRSVLKDAISGTAWNTLCLTGRRLLVRTNKEAACYELPMRKATE